jgi:hypothetical protein
MLSESINLIYLHWLFFEIFEEETLYEEIILVIKLE